MTREEVANWLERYVEAWKSYDREQIGDLFAEDAEVRYHPYDEPVRGRQAVVDSWLAQGEYESWVEKQASLGEEEFGKQEWGAVCAKCHGLAGEGDIGPPIAGNPSIISKEPLRTLLQEGQDTPQFESFMPPVGRGWTAGQYDALIAYIKATPQLSEAPAGVPSGG
jgi:cytochrome c553